MKYHYKKPYLIFLFRIIDSIGYFLFKRRTRHVGQKVLVIRLDQIGDVVLVEPFIRKLKEGRPDTEITLLTTTQGREILKNIPDLKDIYTFNPSWFKARSSFVKRMIDWFRLVKTMKSIDCDTIVILRGDFREILATALTHPKACKIGYGVTGGGFLLNEDVPYKRVGHAVQRNMDLLAPFNIGCADVILRPVIANVNLSREIEKKLPKRDHPWIVCHMGSMGSAKFWPIDHWRSLINKLESFRQCHWIFIGDQGADESAKYLYRNFSRKISVTHLCKQLPLAQLGTFLKMTDLFLTIDSGPGHIAAAHKVPTIVLFSGTNSPKEWRPLNDRAKVLCHKVACAPCEQRVCPKPRHDCMRDLSPEIVYKAIEEQL